MSGAFRETLDAEKSAYTTVATKNQRSVDRESSALAASLRNQTERCTNRAIEDRRELNHEVDRLD
jgi:hypothetical protein